MTVIWKFAVGAVSAFLLAGCVTSPYESAFAVCDNEAGACYQYCEDVATDDDGYDRCHADCERETNRCFAQAYDRNRVAYAGGAYNYQPGWPWYGRYGAWGPTRGYYYGYRSGYPYDGYYSRPPRRRHRDYNGGSGSGSGAGPGAGSGGAPTAERPGRTRSDRNPRDGSRRSYQPDESGPRTSPQSAAPAPQSSAPAARTQAAPPPPPQPSPQSSPPPQSSPEPKPAPRQSSPRNPRRDEQDR